MMPSIILGNNSVAVDPMGLPIASSSRPPVPASGSIPVPGPRRKSNADNVAFPSSANLSSLSSLNTNTRKSSGGGVPGPFGGSGGFMTPTMNQSFVLPLPPNADRALANSTKPLFQRCIDLIAQLYPFPLFEFYLFPDGVDAYMIPAQDGSALPVIADPVDVLWNCFKLGAPLCVVYNEISKTTTGVFLNVDDVSGIRAPFYPTKPCKDNLYKFITACRSELHLVQAQELSGVSELYKDDTAGFMKFLKLVEELVHRIDQAGNMPIARSLPFSTELSKEITNPLDNKSRVIKELVETERAYIFSLEELQRYQNELGATKMFSKDMMQQLFSNLNELLDFQRRFMVGMESTLNLGVSEQRIGQLFVLNEEAFEVYYPFCGNYQNASGFVLSHGDELKLMSHIIQPHSITAYLIKPLQRLMKYPLLLKELVKLTDPETYPYMDELKDGLESIKRVTERLNEVQRRDENERLKQDLIERMEDWKGLHIKDFGDLLLCEKFPIASNDQEREYHLFLFERILLCCKKDQKPSAKRTSNRKRSDAGKEAIPYMYVLRGNIYISSIMKVDDTSDPEFGAFSIRVYWKDVSEPDTVCFSLKCRNEEQVALWTDRLEKQVELYRKRKNSGNPASSFNPMMHRGSDGYSSLTAIAGDPNFAGQNFNPATSVLSFSSQGSMSGSTLNGSQYGGSQYGGSQYGGSQYGGAPRMTRSLSNPYNNNQMYSPISPGGPYNNAHPQYARQGSYDAYIQHQPTYYTVDNMQSGLNSAMMSIPTPGRAGGPNPMMASRSTPGQAYPQGQPLYANPPPMPAMRAGAPAYVEGRSRMDSGGGIAGRKLSGNKGSVGGAPSKSRQALDALASLASSGLPIAGFSDDEDSDGGDDTAAGVARQMQALQLQQQVQQQRELDARKQSMANGMMMGTAGNGGVSAGSMVFVTDGRRPSTDRGFNNMVYAQQQQQQYVPVSGRPNSTDPARNSPLPLSSQVLPNGYQRMSNGAGGPGSPATDSRASPVPSVNMNFQFPPPPQHQNPLQQQFRQSNSSQHSNGSAPRSPNNQQFAPISPMASNGMNPDPLAMRRTPTAPSHLSSSNSSSFIKIRTHYDGDILIIAMPVRGATLQELRSRVERKVNMMPHKAMLSSPIRMAVMEEVVTEFGVKEWKQVRALETDEDVALAFTTNAGFLNLFLS